MRARRPSKLRLPALAAVAGLLCGLVLTVTAATAPTAQAAVTAVTTNPTLFPAFNASVSDYVVRCSPTVPVRVTVSATAGTTVKVDGRAYTELPTAFRYRQEFNAACSCRKPGQSWADAMKVGDDYTVEQGDIVVTDERSRKMSQPVDARGRPIRPELRPSTPATNAPVEQSQQAAEPPKGQVRTVGPTFYPVR